MNNKPEPPTGEFLKATAVKCLLALLNSSFLNPTPCKYEFVGNVDAFSRADIEGTLKDAPTITLREYLDMADRFKTCPISKTGVTVIESDGTYSLNRDMR
jgi:hypothetical protein